MTRNEPVLTHPGAPTHRFEPRLCRQVLALEIVCEAHTPFSRTPYVQLTTD